MDDTAHSSSTPRISVWQEDPNGWIAEGLMRELSTDIARRYADLGDDGSGAFKPEDISQPRSAFVVARLGDEPVGCGALRSLEGGTAEIKRMYVGAKARRMGVGRKILEELEALAAQFGYTTLRLETGDRQPEAIALYERYGFHRIPPFGRYVGNPVSICFEKEITKETALGY